MLSAPLAQVLPAFTRASTFFWVISARSSKPLNSDLLAFSTCSLVMLNACSYVSVEALTVLPTVSLPASKASSACLKFGRAIFALLVISKFSVVPSLGFAGYPGPVGAESSRAVPQN